MNDNREEKPLVLPADARNQWVSIVAHDMRAPVATLKMIINAINLQKISDAALLQKLTMLNDTIDETYNLLENLLRWSLATQGGRTHSSDFDIRKVIDECMASFSVAATMKNITVSNQAEIPIYVHADIEMVRTVLRNLLSNALKFTHQGGRVNVYVESSDSVACVCVEDNGKGMNTEQLERVLADEGVEKALESGHGFGLSIVRDFIRRNGGRFNMASRLGKGSEFCFTLPLKTKGVV